MCCCGRWKKNKKSLPYTTTGSLSRWSRRASWVLIQLVKLQIKHFITSLHCFWMSTYEEGCSCGLLIKMTLSCAVTCPMGPLVQLVNTSLNAAFCFSALSPGSRTSSAVPAYSFMIRQTTGLQPTKKWECSKCAGFRGRMLFARSFVSPNDRKQQEGTFRGHWTHPSSQADHSWKRR